MAPTIFYGIHATSGPETWVTYGPKILGSVLHTEVTEGD